MGLVRKQKKTIKMNKIAILGDCHFGIKQNSRCFNTFFEKFYSNIFFPYLQEHNIKTIVQLGDLFDNRKSMNYNDLYHCKKYFFDKLEENDIHMITLIGNHDSYYRNTIQINSPSVILNNYKHITIIDKPQKVLLNDNKVLMIPWICSENESECMNFIQNNDTNFCFGHFEIKNFSMYKGVDNYDGLNVSIFSKFEFVFSGHFHTRSYRDNIYYLGTPVEHTWNDYNDQKGFHVFDFESRKLDFIENPFCMFHKIYFNENIHDLSLEQYKDTVIKIQTKKCDESFELFLDKLTSVNPFEIIVIEEQESFDNDSNIDEMKDTLTYMNEYIDGITIPDVEPEILKKLMLNIYSSALK